MRVFMSMCELMGFSLIIFLSLNQMKFTGFHVPFTTGLFSE